MLFPYNTLIKKEDICNLEEPRAKLKAACKTSGRVVLFGKRNTGKSSVVENEIIPYFRKLYPKNFVLSCDLLGVTSLEAVASRIASAFKRGFTESFPTKAKLQKMLEVIRGVSPALIMKPDSSFELSIAGWSQPKSELDVKEVFKQIENIANADIQVFIALDEFQDVHFVKGAEAILRNCLERLPEKTTIFLLGSKKHLMSKIVARERAPLYQWGTNIEFGLIHYHTYYSYMSERFKQANLYLNYENSVELQNNMQRNPEAINMLCEEIVANNHNREIDSQMINHALNNLLKSKRSFFEERLVSMTKSESEVLTAIAVAGSVLHPSGKEFQKKINASKAAVTKIINKFLDHATIYKDPDGYRLADPLLSLYLAKFRT